MVALDPIWQLKLVSGGSGHFALLLLNTSEAKPTGAGFAPQLGERIPYSAFRAVQDQVRLVEFRRDRMGECGIRYPFTDDMVIEASASLREATELRSQDRYSDAMRELFDATTRAGTAYPLIWNVMTDTIYALILVFLMVVPFSIFLERLLFGIIVLQRRLMAVLAIFVAICLALDVLHPGFEVATSPYLIPLAFVILALVLIVLSIMLGRFERQMGGLSDVSAQVYAQDVNRVGALWVAFTVGIGNLRRRKTRTALTVVTLILLTYSLLSLTSGEIGRKHFKIIREQEPPYPGVLVRHRQWARFSEVAPEVMQITFGDQAVLAPRCWIYRRHEVTFTIPVEYNGRKAFTYALVGLTPKEAEVSGLNTVVPDQRWFTAGSGPQCMLPANLATAVGLGGADIGRAKVRIYGREFLLAGIFHPSRLDEFSDLDGDPISPLVPFRQQIGTIQREAQFVHLSMTDVVLATYEDLRNMGAGIASIAMRFHDEDAGRALMKDFVSRTDALCFIAMDEHVEAWSYLGVVWISGLKDLIIPLIIAALIVLNTMLNSVYERAREIQIFGSVGLNPLHIAVLFFAESMVYGVIGIMLGYLLGQVSSYMMIQYGVAPGLSLNYSSASAAFIASMVFLLVMVSTAYPAWVAFRAATPGGERAWRPPEPSGDVWAFLLPFNVSSAIVPGLAAFLRRYYDSFQEASIGAFYTESVSLEKQARDGPQAIVLQTRLWLAPFDTGVKQDLTMVLVPDAEDPRVCQVQLRIERVAGTPGDWQRLNKPFFKVLRKQFLIWRTVSNQQRDEFVAEGKEILHGWEVKGDTDES